MEQNNPNPPSTPSGQHVPWSTPTIPQSPLNMGDLNKHLAASINDGIEATTWDPTPPVSSGQMELQGTPTRLDPILDDIINQQGDIADGEDSRMASPIQYNDDEDRRDSSEPVCLGIKLGPSSQSSLRAAIVRLIEETFCTNAGFDREVMLPEEPETINIQSGSTLRASRVHSKGRDHSRSSAWTHLTYESGCSEELAYFQEAVPVPTNIAEFFGDIERAIKHPMLAPPIDLSDMEVEGDKSDEVYGVGYSAGQKEDLAAMIQDLWEEIGRDVSESASGWSEFYLRDMIKLRVGTSILANVQDFNDSMGMVLSALDTGLDDDLTTKGVTPSSWFRLSAALLAAMTRGVLRSRGPKVKGRVKLTPDEDHLQVAPGLGMPSTEGGRIIVMAHHLAELFEQHDKGDNLPFVEYFNNLQRVTQNHIQRAVKLAAVEAYQELMGDAEKIREIVMDDMADQLINQLKDDPVAQDEVECKVCKHMMKKLEAECIEDIEEWRTVYRKGLAAALQAEATGTDILVLSHSQIVQECSEEIQAQVDKKAAEIKDSIIKEEVEKYLLLQETDNAKAIIRHKYLENIEEARHEVRAEIASEKKNWVGTTLSEMTTTKNVRDALPNVRFQMVNGPDLLHERRTITPQAKKKIKKKGRKLVIPKPFSTAGSEASSNEDGMEEDPLPPPDFSFISPPALAPVQPISVPANVRASQQPLGPTRDPATLPETDQLRGVSSSMHNPINVMEEDPKTDEVSASTANLAAPAVALPALPAIPLLPGLAELLNALQTNITTAFSNQISSLTDQMDQQDIRISNITIPGTKGKGVAKARDPPPHLPNTIAPGVRPDVVAHLPATLAPGAKPDAAATNPTNLAPGKPMGPPLGPPPTAVPSLPPRKNGPVPVPRNVTR
ncbi:hypothetical protein BJY52DRAFT_1193141 [Lactarius psammicola]|nr:hypothetical protein BJY52DRAFT_1193141 [Lactarius psammicola]